MTGVTRLTLLRYGVAVVSVALALVLRLLLNPLIGKTAPFSLLLVAVMVSAWYGTRGSSLLAVVLAAAAGVYFFLPSFLSSTLDWNNILPLGMFVLEALLIAGFSLRFKRAETALRESGARFKRLSRSNIVGVVLADISGRIIKANDAFLRMLGYTREDLLAGKVRWDERLAPEYLYAEERALKELKMFGVCKLFEKEYIRADGQRVPVLVGLTLLEDPPTDYVGVVVDLTERRRVEEALREEVRHLSTVIWGLAAASEKYASVLEAKNEASEMKVRFLTHLASEAIISADSTGNIVFWNKGAQAVFGYAEADVLGTPLTLLIPERDHEAHRQGWRRMRLTSQSSLMGKIIELRGRHKDGHEFPLELSLTTWKGGEQTFYTGLIRDITERKRAEAARAELVREQITRAEAAERRAAFFAEASTRLAASPDYPTTLVNVARLAVLYLADWCILDAVGEDRSLRRLAVAHVGSSKVERVWEVERPYPTDLDPPYGPMQVLRTGQPEIYSEVPDSMLVAIARDAKHLNTLRKLGFKSYMSVPLSAHGRTVGVLSLVSAESDRRYGPADLALAKDFAHLAALAIDHARPGREAQETPLRQEPVLKAAAHEARTPSLPAPEWDRWLAEAPVKADITARVPQTPNHPGPSPRPLSDGELDVSRLMTGKLHLDVRPVDLVPVIEAAIEVVRPAAEAKAIQLETRLDPQAGSVLGDPARLQQVVWHLLTNAIKFTAKGGQVEVRLARAHSDIEITVSDRGEGIRAEFLPYIFDGFRPSGDGPGRGGFGMGLVIVRRLIELHGGTVQAQSLGAGQGASFTVQLPLAPLGIGDRGLQNEISPIRNPQSAIRNPRSPIRNPRLTGSRVLVVDDEADAREVLADVLAQDGATVRTCGSAAEALAIIELWRPDVLVSDIDMPGQDGYALIRQVRALEPERGGQTPAVAITAYPRGALLAGFHMCVAKPIEPPRLMAIIAKLAGRAEKASASSAPPSS